MKNRSYGDIVWVLVSSIWFAIIFFICAFAKKQPIELFVVFLTFGSLKVILAISMSLVLSCKVKTEIRELNKKICKLKTSNRDLEEKFHFSEISNSRKLEAIQNLKKELKEAKTFENVEKVVISEEAFKLNYGGLNAVIKDKK